MTLDSLIGNSTEFPILRNWDFFNHAGVSPFPRCCAEAMRGFATQFEQAAYLDSPVYRQIDELRIASAGLIKAYREEIAFVKNTSEGIATVAAGIDFKPGDRIVTTAVEYPANMYPWMDLSRRKDVELVTVAEEDAADGSRYVPQEKILAVCDHPRTRLLALSHVEFASGQRHDLGALGQFCRSRGILFSVDGIQTVGALPVDVQAMNIDFLSADGHKWMLGPEGAAMFYCRRKLLPQVHPPIIGWMNVINEDDYGHYDFTLKPDARKFECGSHNLAGIVGLKASLEMLAGAGIDQVAARIKALTDRLIVGLKAKGYRILSPRQGEMWSGIVSFASPTQDHREIVRTLRRQHKTEIALREGRLRISPHFYNTEEQIDRVVENLPTT